MRFLLITTAFPPYNSLGAIRMGKLAKYLVSQGHDVRVLAAKDPPLLPTLPLEIPAGQVMYTPWFNVNFLPNLLFGGKKKVAQQGYSTKSSWLKSLGNLYRDLLHFPDDQVGWYPYALRAGRTLMRSWKPDMIYASAMPFTSLLAAAQLSRETGVPWLGELRDLWADHAYYVYPAWRRRPESWLERRTLSSASGLVTVSEPLAEKLREKYDRPVAVILNGYDLDDYPAEQELAKPDPVLLRIAYTGSVYPQHQDLGPLFQALQSLGTGMGNIRLDFYTRYTGPVLALAEQYGVAPLVQTHGLVPYREALKKQMEADLLLMLLWNDPAERGVLTGKLFEYIGSRRPILAVGAGHDLAADLIRKRQAGFVSNDPQAIAAQLLAWQQQKAELGAIPSLPLETRQGLSRQDQFAELEKFIHRL